MKALLLSNSTNYGASYMEHAKDAVALFLGEAKEVLFIPYAGVTVSYDQYEQTVQNALKGFGITIKSIHKYNDPIQAVKEAKAIAIGGGNTFRLVQLLQDQNLMEPIREAVAAGAPYVGWSAGSNVAG